MKFNLPFELPKGWEIKTVEDLIKDGIIEKPLDGNHGGAHPKSSDFVSDGVPFIMASDLESGIVNLESCKFITMMQADNLKKGIAKAGDVLLSHKATIGRTSIVQMNKHSFIVLTPQITYYRIKNKNRLNNIYLKSYFDSYYFQSLLALWAGAGSTRAYLGITDQLKLPIIIPNIDTQLEIAKQVGNLTAKAATNKQINQTLEAMAQALFKSWFVDFEPVHAKIKVLEAGGNEEDANLAAMSVISGKSLDDLASLKITSPEAYEELHTTASLFPSRLVESELGNIPDGWKIKKIGEVARIIKGKSYKSSELSKSNTALVTLKSFNRGGGYRLDGLKEYIGDYKSEQEVFAGDLIIAYTDVTQAADVIGKPAMVINDLRYKHLVISLDVALVKPFNTSLKYYLYGLARTKQFQQHTNAHSTGTTVLHLSSNAIPEYAFALPNSILLNAYERIVEPSFDLINKLVPDQHSNLGKATSNFHVSEFEIFSLILYILCSLIVILQKRML